MGRKTIKIIKYCTFVLALFLLLDGVGKTMSKGRLYSLEAQEVIQTKDSRAFLYSSSRKEKSNYKNTYLVFSGIDTIAELAVTEEQEFTIVKKEYLGNGKIIIADKNNENIMLEMEDEAETRIALSEGVYRVLVVGNAFCGNIQIDFV